MDSLISPLSNISMSINKETFNKIFNDPKYSQVYNIQRISDYNTLSTIAQQEGLPVNLVSKKDLKIIQEQEQLQSRYQKYRTF